MASCLARSRAPNPVPSRSAYRRRRTWRPTGSICWRGRIPMRLTDRRRPSGFNRGWRKPWSIRRRSRCLRRSRPTGRGRGVAPGRRRPGAQDRVRRHGRADPGPGLRAVPRGRRHRHSSPLRDANAADDGTNGGLLELGGPAGPSDGAGTAGEDRALVKAMVGLQAGKTPHQIAMDIYGADEVAANWYSDGGMRSQLRRWISKVA